LIPIAEETLSKALDPAVSIATPRPIQHGEDRWHRDGVDLLAFGNE
jgi:hypothetical protein